MPQMNDVTEPSAPVLSVLRNAHSSRPRASGSRGMSVGGATLVAAAITTAGLVTLSSPAAAHQPGRIFCDAANSRTEHAICASKRLVRVNRQMDRQFKRAREAAADRYALQDLHAAQRAFVLKRDRCGAFRFCIWWRTKDQIRSLQRFVRRS
ncbi:MAG: lysozyme inhibitor LprI family protein [Pseudomonadota bacterium]